jgi:hypothetical protein
MVGIIIMFTRGFWMHENFSDVFIFVLRVEETTSDYTKITAEWFNKSQIGKPFPLMYESIKIHKEEYKNWFPLGYTYKSITNRKY